MREIGSRANEYKWYYILIEYTLPTFERHKSQKQVYHWQDSDYGQLRISRVYLHMRQFQSEEQYARIV
jgi:hypothetical protein